MTVGNLMTDFCVKFLSEIDKLYVILKLVTQTFMSFFYKIGKRVKYQSDKKCYNRRNVACQRLIRMMHISLIYVTEL